MHKSVLLDEVVSLLVTGQDGTYVDGTLGSAGHALAILEKAGPGTRLIGLDRDPAALERADRRLARYASRVQLVHASFAEMREVAEAAGAGDVKGIVLDLGVSSDQLGEAERGFSFMKDGPLDMRMDPEADLSALQVVNEWSVAELRQIIRELGEERYAGRVAHAIVHAREQAPITRTGRLAEVVAGAVGGRPGRIHPATRTFQALRMAVNDELGALRKGLEAGLELLATGGRMAVITFHSLEDRLVKTFFRAHAGRHESLQAGGSKWCGEEPPVRLVNRKVIVPTAEEQSLNPRARSAKLRVAERLAEIPSA